MRGESYLFKIGLEREGYFQQGYLSQMLPSQSLKQNLCPLQVQRHAVSVSSNAKKRTEENCGEKRC
jgi:hypothetical protein